MSLLDDGYEVIQTPLPEIQSTHDYIRSEVPLKGWADDLIHIQTQKRLSDYLHYKAKKILSKHVEYFKQLIGPDLLIHKYPYLRMARPGKAQDNIGIHRDTLYGSSPYEVSVLIPLSNMTGGAAMKVLPGSHVKPSNYYPYTEGESQCDKLSDKHKLGFLYAPKVMSKEVIEECIPINLSMGDILVFFPSLVHGQEVNTSEEIRLSMDSRIVNSLAPVNTKRAVHSDYFEFFSMGTVETVARSYES